MSFAGYGSPRVSTAATAMGTARQKVIKKLADNMKTNKNVNKLVLSQSLNYGGGERKGIPSLADHIATISPVR